MSEIVLTTLNAKYIHASFGLRYLLANLGDLRPRAELVEFDIKQRPLEIVEVLLAKEPGIVGFGVYIWNVRETTEVVGLIKRLRPGIQVVLGGPEVSYEWETQEVAGLADHVIAGEADLAFAELCRQLLEGRAPAAKVIPAIPPAVGDLTLPYELYSDEDIANRVVYVEASRGCPFTCEFCLSSLEVPVRAFPLEPFLEAIGRLYERGVRQFKFVDRTFNLNLKTARRILEFFLERQEPGLFVHFEMVPDRLPEALREIIARFPTGTLQFEVGIQSFNPEVSERIRRRQNVDRLSDNFRFLRGETGVHIHADLIVGLPGECLESFGEGFDRLIELRPQEIQVGILKRLRGTPIGRHDEEWGMVYSPRPPYEILENRDLSFRDLQRMRHFSRYWDLVANSGNFHGTLELIWRQQASPFAAFLGFADWLWERANRHHGIALARLAGFLFEFLTDVRKQSKVEVAEAIATDYGAAGRRDTPPFLRPFLPSGPGIRREAARPDELPPRQARHLAGHES